MTTAIMTKRYVGTAGQRDRVEVQDVTIRRTDHGDELEVVATRPLRHLMRHSPDGFSWGYGGSGPSDLARSILADVTGQDPDPTLYHAFKFAIVAHWPMDQDWVLMVDDVTAWLLLHAAVPHLA